MTIGIDAGALSISDKRLEVGVYQVTLNFIVNLSKIDKTNSYEIYTFKPLKDSITKQLGSNFKNVVCQHSRFRGGNQLLA